MPSLASGQTKKKELVPYCISDVNLTDSTVIVCLRRNENDKTYLQFAIARSGTQTSLIYWWVTGKREPGGQQVLPADLSAIGVNFDPYGRWLITETATIHDL